MFVPGGDDGDDGDGGDDVEDDDGLGDDGDTLLVPGSILVEV